MEIIINNIREAKKNLEILQNEKIIKEINSFSIQATKALKKNKKLIFCGNGGSAADSNHLVAELVGRFMKNRIALNAISLASNTSTLTAISNDYEYSKVFSRQIEAVGNSGDVLVCITTSGKSKNILRAIDYAQKRKINIIFLTSKKFKKKIKNAVIIKVPAERVDRIQEMHICIGHIFCEEIENFFC